MMHKTIFVIGIAIILLSGCTTVDMAVSPDTQMSQYKSVCVTKFKTIEPGVGKTVSDGIKEQLARYRVSLRDEANADLIVTGTVTVSRDPEALNDTDTWIKEVTFEVKDKEGNLVMGGEVEQGPYQSFFNTMDGAREIGKKIGIKIAKKLKNLK
jgi:hypothetical protein